MTKTTDRILIIKPSALGDIATVLPALDSLKQSYPQAHISWLVRKEFAVFLEGNPQIDEIIIFDRRLLAGFWRSWEALKALSSFLSKLRKSRFDVVIDFQGLFRTGFFSIVTGAKKRIGMSTAREFAGLFYNHKVKPDSHNPHVLEYYFRLIEAAGAKRVLKDSYICVDQANEVWWEKYAAQNSINIDNYAVLVPGASRPDKCWPPKNFAETAGLFRQKYGLDIVVVGSKAEAVLAEEISKSCSFAICDLAGKTDLNKLKAVLKSAKIVLSNDTGPAHMAFMAGVKTFIIFGSTNPKRVGPFGKKDWSVCVDHEGRGSEVESCDPKHTIENVTVDMVMEKITKYL